MNWILSLSHSHPVAHAILITAAVAMLGLALGSIKIRGISLGVAGVLFAGIIAGSFHPNVAAEILSFLREFGLILFVYTIGMQVGPGFFTSLRQQGIPLNLMAATVVLLGAAATLLLAWLARIDMAAAVGIFAGATTNTPALGAAQDALKSLPNIPASQAPLPAVGYAVAYPFGILGIILAMLTLKRFFRIDSAEELAKLQRELKAGQDPVQRRTLLVQNRNLDGLKLDQIPGKEKLGIIISRVRRAGETEASVADSQTAIHHGDLLLAVGARANLNEFSLIVGKEAPEDLAQAPGPVAQRRFVATRRDVLGKTLRELALAQIHGVNVTRVTRADIEMTAIPDLKIQFGDMLHVVGKPSDLDRLSEVLGNSVKQLNHTNLIPIFLGIALGILLGLYPFTLPGVPAPVRLGLAGGPLIAAILLSRLGKIGPLIWHMPVNANILLRELGIALFLASVGLKAGEHFLDLIRNGDGLLWMACGAVITLVPLLIVSLLGRLLLKLNFISLCGLLSGSMTDPPALAFANALNQSDGPSIAYATVYPFTMLLRIFIAQIMVLAFCR